MLTRIKSGFKALILLQIFLTNSSSCKCKLLMLTNLSGLWKDMDSWTRSNLALSTFIGISVLITRLVKTSPLTIRDSLFLPSFRVFMSLFWFQSHLTYTMDRQWCPRERKYWQTPKGSFPVTSLMVQSVQYWNYSIFFIFFWNRKRWFLLLNF